MSSDKIIEEWIICFGGDCQKHWVQRLLKPGYFHCFAFKLSPGGQFYIVINGTRSHTHVDLLPANDDNFNKLTNDYKFVKVIAEIDVLKDRGHLCRFNCVEQVKSLLGLSEFWTWTPYQLYKRLQNG